MKVKVLLHELRGDGGADLEFVRIAAYCIQYIRVGVEKRRVAGICSLVTAWSFIKVPEPVTQ
jgi:hypothetical protein